MTLMNIFRYWLIFVAALMTGCAISDQPFSTDKRTELRAIPALHIDQAIWKAVQQTKDWEDAELRIYKQADIDRDTIDDTVLIASFEIANDNNSYQKLFVCLSSSPQKVMELRVGSGKGDRLADEIDITNSTIIIKGKKYGKDDAMCCPSVAYQSTFTIINGKLVEGK